MYSTYQINVESANFYSIWSFNNLLCSFIFTTMPSSLFLGPKERMLNMHCSMFLPHLIACSPKGSYTICAICRVDWNVSIKTGKMTIYEMSELICDVAEQNASVVGLKSLPRDIQNRFDRFFEISKLKKHREKIEAAIDTHCLPTQIPVQVR